MKFIRNKQIFKDTVVSGSMVSLRNSREFLATFKELGVKIISLSLLSSGRVTSRVKMLNNIGHYLLRMYTHHGDTYVVKYLKACQLAIQKSIAGTPFQSLREIEPDLPLPRLSSRGLPVIISINDRRSIYNLSPTVIRMWLSIFSCYRIISIPSKFKLNTITDPFSGDIDMLEVISS